MMPARMKANIVSFALFVGSTSIASLGYIEPYGGEEPPLFPRLCLQDRVPYLSHLQSGKYFLVWHVLVSILIEAASSGLS
jgi:hypothetical protein